MGINWGIDMNRWVVNVQFGEGTWLFIRDGWGGSWMVRGSAGRFGKIYIGITISKELVVERMSVNWMEKKCSGEMRKYKDRFGSLAHRLIARDANLARDRHKVYIRWGELRKWRRRMCWGRRFGEKTVTHSNFQYFSYDFILEIKCGLTVLKILSID